MKTKSIQITDFKYLLIIVLFISSINPTMGQRCKDISTSALTSFLNQKIKPSLDMKLDKNDGFLAIKRQRQNFSVPEVKVSPISREWVYYFENVRSMDSNFFFDTRLSSLVLDIKFEADGPEIKGLCPGCLLRRAVDDRAPDINWSGPQILRIFLKPVMYQNSVSFEVTDIKFIGDFKANGLGAAMTGLKRNIISKTKTEMIKLFGNGETKRLFNDAIKPLLTSNGIGRSTSVTIASRSLRVCR